MCLSSFTSALDTARQEFVEVVGEEGHLRLESAFLPGTKDAAIQQVMGGSEHEETIPGTDEYQAMVEHFSDCVLQGAEPRYGALEAAANLAVIEALYASARGNGTPVRVTQL